MDDVIFNILIAQDIGQPYQELNVIGQLISLEKKPNQTLFCKQELISLMFNLF